MLLLGGGAAWFWFHPLLAILLVGVMHGLVRREAPAVVRLSARQVRGARLGPWRIWVKVRRGSGSCGSLEVFADELSPEDWTRLRRWLKSLSG